MIDTDDDENRDDDNASDREVGNEREREDESENVGDDNETVMTMVKTMMAMTTRMLLGRT